VKTDATGDDDCHPYGGNGHSRDESLPDTGAFDAWIAGKDIVRPTSIPICHVLLTPLDIQFATV
jgi:hypothetical protein